MPCQQVGGDLGHGQDERELPAAERPVTPLQEGCGREAGVRVHEMGLAEAGGLGQGPGSRASCVDAVAAVLAEGANR